MNDRGGLQQHGTLSTKAGRQHHQEDEAVHEGDGDAWTTVAVTMSAGGTQPQHPSSAKPRLHLPAAMQSARSTGPESPGPGGDAMSDISSAQDGFTYMRVTERGGADSAEASPSDGASR